MEIRPSNTPPNPPTDPPANPPEPPQAPPAPPTPVAPPDPPPAAKTVQEGTKTERELALEKDLKAREQRMAELEDENRRLKTPPAPPANPKSDKAKRSWMSGHTFFHDPED